MTKLPLSFELNLGDAPAGTRSVAQGQSRMMSFVEALANVWVGYGVAVLTQVLVFPLFGLSTTLAQNLQMGCCIYGGLDHPLLCLATPVRSHPHPNVAT